MNSFIRYLITISNVALLITSSSCNQTAAVLVATTAVAPTDTPVPVVTTAMAPTDSPDPDVTVPDNTPSVAQVKIPAFYAHHDVLVDVNWVAAHLTDPTVRIVDAREPFEQSLYPTGHIPGAVFVNTFRELCCPSKIMGVDSFAKLMGSLGIGNNTIVVVYDTDGGLWAARFWWALKYYGHDQVKMLNGGLLQWVLEGQPVETELPEAVTPVEFTARPQPQWLATHDEVKKAIDDPAIVILDALTLPNYNGDLRSYDRPGHITTALSFPAPDTLESTTRMILSSEELSRMMMRLNLDPKQRIITYCGGGFYGAHVAFILYLMGFENVGLYDGSLMEWAADPSNPMEVVP